MAFVDIWESITWASLDLSGLNDILHQYVPISELCQYRWILNSSVDNDKQLIDDKLCWWWAIAKIIYI